MASRPINTSALHPYVSPFAAPLLPTHLPDPLDLHRSNLQMGGSIDLVNDGVVLDGKAQPLPQEFGPEELPPLAGVENGGAGDGAREIVLGRNVHTMSLAVSEPEADDEVTGDREAYMASVLARYRRSLVERTKHHLGIFVSSPLLCLGNDDDF